MKNGIRGLVFVVGLGAFVLGGVGCRTIRGGGWIAGRDGGKATIGFQLVCNQETNGASGELEYVDPRAGVAIHGVADSVPLGDCNPGGSVFGGASEFYGNYTPQPANLGPGGRFYVYVKDNGKPGPSPDDYFSILLDGGVHDGYSNRGNLGGGNVTAF